jgi:hypothetical protein
MGVVYEAYDEALDIAIAVKLIRPEELDGPSRVRFQQLPGHDRAPRSSGAISRGLPAVPRGLSRRGRRAAARRGPDARGTGERPVIGDHGAIAV